MASDRIFLSVVVPLYNEAENVLDLHRELVTALERLGRPFEVLLVDDGSQDGTTEKVLDLEARDPRVRAVLLRRNFGQTAAFSAGFDLARGEVVVTSDGDLQNDPADIPALVRRLDDGFDLVCGWRKERHDPLSKRLPSYFANRLISWATGVRLHDYGCSLKAMRAEVVRGIKLYGEMHRFIPAVASWMGVRVAELPVNHRPRTRGSSKYGIGRTVRVLLDLFTVKFLQNYGTRPAHLFGLMGLAFGGLGAGDPRLPGLHPPLPGHRHRRAAPAPARRPPVPDRGHPRELRPHGRAAGADLPREPGQADLRDQGARRRAAPAEEPEAALRER